MTWATRVLRGTDPETFAEAVILVEQLAADLNNLLKARKRLPGWSNDPLVLSAERHLNEFREGPK